MTRNKKLVIGNWKMNFTVHEASLLLNKLSKLIKIRHDVEVVLAPPMIALQTLSLQVDLRQFKLAAQNLYWRDHGAYTGETSASQLRSLVKYAIIGHSERRNIFGENGKEIRSKMAAAIRNNICPILCVGENAIERASGETYDVLHDQIVGGLANITSHDMENVVIAYEPVWAVGTGKDATPDGALAAIKSIRSQLRHLYGDKKAKETKVLYGGSVNTDVAAGYLSLGEIDGLLVGEASLDANAFSRIVGIAHRESGESRRE